MCVYVNVIEMCVFCILFETRQGRGGYIEFSTSNIHNDEVIQSRLCSITMLIVPEAHNLLQKLCSLESFNSFSTNCTKDYTIHEKKGFKPLFAALSVSGCDCVNFVCMYRMIILSIVRCMYTLAAYMNVSLYIIYMQFHRNVNLN